MKVTVIPDKNWKELSDRQLGGVRENTVCIVRYGGLGDAIQSSSLFPLLKEQGYNVCVNVTGNGVDMLRTDPNIDELLVQDDNQIPNDELGPYIDRLKPLFSNLINTNGVVEGNLICLPTHINYGSGLFDADHETRHKALNKNYAEALHDRAGLPYKFKTHFYSSPSERKWVKREKKRMKVSPNDFLVAITLSGSAVHKAYPHMDTVISRMLLTWPEVRIVLMGDYFCKLLEAGWEHEPRVFATSGEWGIRRAITFAQKSDLVIGPETGVLNAVGMDKVSKICLLSHSSEENLTKHWVNSISLGPTGVECFPCHKMHINGFKTCNRDEETGGAMCAAKIDPDSILKAIEFGKTQYRKSA